MPVKSSEMCEINEKTEPKEMKVMQNVSNREQPSNLGDVINCIVKSTGGRKCRLSITIDKL